PQDAAGTPRSSRARYQRPTTRCSSPSDNASTARTRAQFPKSCPLAETRECAEKLCRTIAQRNCPKGPTIPRLPLSNRTSWNGSQYNQDVVIKIWLGAERSEERRVG